jgi:hypothetical protein
MNLYIPEIGDHIKLTKDWNFSLHPEMRNYYLGKFFHHYTYWGNRMENTWIDSRVIPRLREADYNVKYPDSPEYKNSIFGNSSYRDAMKKYEEDCEQARLDCPEYVQWDKDSKDWRDACDKAEYKLVLPVTIPAGTILAIDRIYIRKGSSDFSSITFYAKNLGEIEKIVDKWHKPRKAKQKALRFWAKLSDVNTIEFEPTEKIK